MYGYWLDPDRVSAEELAHNRCVSSNTRGLSIVNRLLRRTRWQFAAAALATATITVSGIASATAADNSGAARSTTSRAACAKVTWGSTPETVSGSTSGVIVSARAGRHDCYDRFVVDVVGSVTGYDVRYVDAVWFGGTGHLVELRGNAILQVIVKSPAPGELGYNELEFVDVSGFRTIRQVAMVDALEDQTLMGLGIRARLPFRVFVLPGSTSRVVVDIAHQW
jgi:hypothetical protein